MNTSHPPSLNKPLALGTQKTSWGSSANHYAKLETVSPETFSFSWIVAYLGIEPPALEALMARLDIHPCTIMNEAHSASEPHRASSVKHHTYYDKRSVALLQQALQLVLPPKGEPLSHEEQERIMETLKQHYQSHYPLEQKTLPHTFKQPISPILPFDESYSSFFSHAFQGLSSMLPETSFSPETLPSDTLHPPESQDDTLFQQGQERYGTHTTSGMIRAAGTPTSEPETLTSASANYTTLGGHSVEELLHHIAFLRESLQAALITQIHEAVTPVETLGVELLRLQEHNRLLEQKVIVMEQTLHQLQQELDSFKPFQFGLYKKITPS
ncbi:MAG: hypothetical protein ACKO37_00770 [Vampirovibrionales bacterium]